MARQSDLDPTRIFEICYDLFARGENTSFDKVYSALGRKGSAAVVTKAIGEWRNEAAEKLNTKRSNPDLPDDLTRASDELVGAIWKLALGKADSAYLEKENELAAEKIDWANRIDVAETNAAELERMVLVRGGELKALAAQLEAREEAISDLQSRLATASSLLAEKDTQVTGLREDIARLAATLDSERARHTADLAAERQRHDAAQQSERDRHAAETKALREQHASEQARALEIAQGERKHLMEQTDQIRTTARQREEYLAEQLKNEKAKSNGFERQANDARDREAVARGRAELLQEQLEAANLREIQRQNGESA